LIYTRKLFETGFISEQYNSTGWNREHVWAKSYGFPDKSIVYFVIVKDLNEQTIQSKKTIKK
jgi:hypothetical protein